MGKKLGREMGDQSMGLIAHVLGVNEEADGFLFLRPST